MSSSATMNSRENWISQEWGNITPPQIKATMVVPQSDDTVTLQPGGKKPNWMKLPVGDTRAQLAKIIDWRPGLGKDTNALVVLWLSNRIHQGQNTSKRYPASPKWCCGGTTGVIREDGTSKHFKVSEMEAANTHLHQYGFVVVDFTMSQEELRVFIDSFKESIQLLNRETIDPGYPTCPRLSKITKKHMPPLLGFGLGKYYGAPHTPFADACRLYEPLKRVFEHLHGTDEILPSFDCMAVTKTAKGRVQNWLHQDQTAEYPGLSIQGNFILKSPWARLGMMVSYYRKDGIDDLPKHVQFLKDARMAGHCLTHDNRLNNKVLPTWQPNPKNFLHLKCINGNRNIPGYWERFNKIIQPTEASEPPAKKRRYQV